jgi:hypothetical protein
MYNAKNGKLNSHSAYHEYLKKKSESPMANIILPLSLFPNANKQPTEKLALL